MVGAARFERCVRLNYERVSESGLGCGELETQRLSGIRE